MSGQVHRHGTDRDLPLTDLALVVDLLGHAERALEERVEHLPRGAVLRGGQVCLFDLAVDLRLADHHRVQPGRYAEEVANRRFLRVHVHVLVESRGPVRMES